MRDPKDLRSLETIDLIPVDLNSLLYNAERTIAAWAFVRNGRGDDTLFRRFTQRADARKRAILAMYDPRRDSSSIGAGAPGGARSSPIGRRSRQPRRSTSALRLTIRADASPRASSATF